MSAFLLVGLLLVIIFSVIFQLLFKSALVVAGIVLVISLIVFAFFQATLGLIFIAWIVIYTVTAFVVSLITCKFLKNNNNF